MMSSDWGVVILLANRKTGIVKTYLYEQENKFSRKCRLCDRTFEIGTSSKLLLEHGLSHLKESKIAAFL
jgi:hypothetical protein